MENEKKRTLGSGDREAAKRVQKQLSVRIRDGKEAYRRKLQQNDTREGQRGMRTITGYKASSQPVDRNIVRANELTCFFNRFDMQPQIDHSDQQPHSNNDSSSLLTVF